jgi:tripartite-type tricarboxylate transporter receptor subunit TctC
MEAAMLRRALLAASLAGTLARAQPVWPSRPIRIVNPFPAGSPDAMARFIAERLSPALGQPVLVESRSGAGGTIGAELVAHAPADGYVLGISSVGPHAVAPTTFAGLRYDPLREVTHLALLGELPLALAVGAAGPYADLAGFLAAARAQPGAIRVGTVGTGGIGHISLEMLRRATGAVVTIVPFRGGTAAALETMGGRTEASIASLGEVGGQDRLRLLALASEARAARHPAVPTFRESGVELVANVWFGFCGPAGLAPAIVARLERELRAITGSPGYATLLDGLGAAPHRDLDAAGMTAFVMAEAQRWGEAARAAGIRAE